MYVIFVDTKAVNVDTSEKLDLQKGRRFVSAADYVKYKKAASLAGSSPSPVLPPQTTVITQLQNAGC